MCETAHFGSLSATVTPIDRSSLQVVTPACPEGVVSVQMKTSREFEQAASIDGYEFSGQAANITRLSPASGMEDGGTVVRIDVTNLLDDFTVDLPTVTFGGVAAAVKALGASSVEATTPAHAVGNVDVVVQGSVSGKQAVAANGYLYFDANGVITSVTPRSGKTQGGAIVRITTACFNTDFTKDLPEVFFGTERAPQVTPIDSRTLEVRTPAHPFGTVEVKVVAPNGEAAVRPAAYTFC